MTKQQFLNELNRLLHSLPENDRNDILYDYESHIQSAMDNGKSEEEAVFDLGSPQAIANELLGMSSDTSYTESVEDREQERHSVHFGRSLFAVLCVIFFNLIFVIGPFCGVLGVFIGFYAASLSCMLTPIGLIIDIFTNDTPILLAFFFVLAACSFGYLFLSVTNYLAKQFYAFMWGYVRWNLKFVRGEY